jgi:ABC-type transport system involved in multi-copper enzyme maturation permease subunit
MSTVTETRRRAEPGRIIENPSTGLSFGRIMNSELIKFRSLRSSWITLLAAVLTLFGIGLLLGWTSGKNFATLAPEDALPSGVLQGYFLGQLLIGVLGVLFVSGEYSTGMIRSTLAAVPKRLPVLLAKAVVFGGIALVTMTTAALATFLGAQVFLRHYGHGTGLTDPGVLRVVLGTGLHLALIGLLGGALGWILRNTAGAISTLVGLLLVIPVLVMTLPWQWTQDIGKYLPADAGGAFVNSFQSPNALTPGAGLAVLVAWVVGAFALAAVLLKRRDA